MKRIGLILLVIFFTTVCFGQNGGVLKFLGIPVEGSQDQFVEHLTGLGFAQGMRTDTYRGVFNGRSVDVSLHTNHDAVNQVVVTFQDTTAQKVVEEYNQLIDLFRKDKSYMDFNQNEVILENADVAQRLANGKHYEAHFSYYDPDRNPSLTEALVDELSDFFTEVQRAKLKELIKKAADAPEDQKAAVRVEIIDEMKQMGLGQDGDAKPDPGKVFRFMGAFMEGLKTLSDGDVWLQILEHQKQYCIVLHFDVK